MERVERKDLNGWGGKSSKRSSDDLLLAEDLGEYLEQNVSELSELGRTCMDFQETTSGSTRNKGASRYSATCHLL